MRKIVFLAGGTLGHIYPTISFINSLDKKKYQIMLIVTKKDKRFNIEEKVTEVDIKYIEAYGINRKNLFNIILKNINAYHKIKQILKDFKPNIVIGMGGYISGIGIYSAIRLKIKTVIHEQNSIMGLANKLVYKKVDRLLVSYKMNLKNELYIGNPRYIDSKNYVHKKSFISNKNNLLFISGSLGSKRINELVVEFINSELSNKYFITVITGEKYYEDVKKSIYKNNVLLIPKTSNMLEHISNNDIIISRSGSSSIFEILGRKKVSILIPSPNVTNNHQEYNSKLVSYNSLGEVILEKDLSLEYFVKVLNRINKDYQKYINNLNNFDMPETNKLFIDCIKELTGDFNE